MHSTIRQWRYTPSATDRLWLLRAVEAEGEPRIRVAAALVNRFCWLRANGRGGTYKYLWQFVRAYCAPVNSRRMRGGDIWEKNWLRAERLEPEERDRRQKLLREAHERRKRHCSRSMFSAMTEAAVLRALTQRPELPRVTDFAAADHPPSEGLVLVEKGLKGENALYSAADPSWRGYQIGTERELTPELDALIWVEKVVLIAYGAGHDDGGVGGE